MMTFQTIFSFRKTYKLDIETQLDTQKLGNMSLQILRKGENEMAKKELIPFVLLGYIAIAYMKLPVMGVAILGTAIALLVFFNAGRKGEDSVEEVEVEFEDGI